MKEEFIMHLVDIRDEMQSFMQYDELNDKFEQVYESWKEYGIRHRFHSRNFYYRVLREQIIPRSDAESLCHYISGRHFWKCLM